MIILQSIIKRLDVRSNPSVPYVFGDNEVRLGYGGQAGEMRGETNAIGIATLKAPGIFWSEKDAARQCRVIDGDMARLLSSSLCNYPIIWPRDNIGTGLAQLPICSPSTYRHLSARLLQLMNIRPDIEKLKLHDEMVEAKIEAYKITRAVLVGVEYGGDAALIEEDADEVA